MTLHGFLKAVDAGFDEAIDVRRFVPAGGEIAPDVALDIAEERRGDAGDAGKIETVDAPELVVRTWMAANEDEDITEAEVREACEGLDPLWDELFPAEQTRIVQLLVERVDVRTAGVAIRLRTEGFAYLCAELRALNSQQRAA